MTRRNHGFNDQQRIGADWSVLIGLNPLNPWFLREIELTTRSTQGFRLDRDLQ